MTDLGLNASERLTYAAWVAGLEPDELRDWLRSEVERLRSHSNLDSGAERGAEKPGQATRAGAAGD